MMLQGLKSELFSQEILATKNEKELVELREQYKHSKEAIATWEKLIINTTNKISQLSAEFIPLKKAKEYHKKKKRKEQVEA
jgi:hypothetical protein